MSGTLNECLHNARFLWTDAVNGEFCSVCKLQQLERALANRCPHTTWLLERRWPNHPVKYFTGVTRSPLEPWTEDPHKAVRFPTEASAEEAMWAYNLFKSWGEKRELCAAEHMFIDGSEASLGNAVEILDSIRALLNGALDVSLIEQQQARIRTLEEALETAKRERENLAVMTRRGAWLARKQIGDTGLKVWAGQATELLHKYGLPRDGYKRYIAVIEELERESAAQAKLAALTAPGEYDSLPPRLRAEGPLLCKEAATAIEQLRAQNRELKRHWEDAVADYVKQKERAEQAEAKVRELEAEMDQMAGYLPEPLPPSKEPT